MINMLKRQSGFSILLSIIVLACLLGASFAALGQMPRDRLRMAAVAWQLQLAGSNLAMHHLPLHIVSYEPAGVLRTDDDVARFQRQLAADGNFIPVFDGVHSESFRLITFLQYKRQAMSRDGLRNPDEAVMGIQQRLFPLVHKEASVMNIRWEYRGAEFYSQCLYDGQGVVYDNILSNIVFVGDAGQGAGQVDIAPGVAQETSSITKSAHPVNLNIYWIWGSLRGHIDVYHYAQITDGLVMSQWGQYDGWMTLGTAQGAYNDIDLSSYYAKAQWAYGWATPLATVSITWNSDQLKFDISITGIGSSGSGQGTNVIYP